MGLGNKDKRIIDEWELKTGEAVKSVNALAKSIRAEAAHEKKLALIRRELDADSKKLTTTSKHMTRANQAAAHAAGTLLAGALSKLGRAIKNTVKQGLDYEDWIGTNTGHLQKLRQETAGLVSDLQLARTQTRLTTGDFKLNAEQIGAVTKAAIRLTRVNKEEFSVSLDKVTKSIKSGSTRALKELGINVDLVGNASQKSAAAVRIITERFGAMKVQAENTNEKIEQLTNSFNNASGAFGSFIARTIAGQRGVAGITRHINDLADAMNKITPHRKKQMDIQDRLKAVNAAIASKKNRGADMSPYHLRTGNMAGYRESRKELKELYAERERLEKKFSANRKAEQVAEQHREYDMIKKRQDDREAERRANKMQGVTQASKYGQRGGRGSRAGGDALYFPGRLDEPPGAPTLDQTKSMLAGEGESPWIKAADGIEKVTLASQMGIPALQRWGDALSGALGEVRDMGLSTLSQFAGAMWSAADAAIQGGDSFGMAMAKMTKATLLGIAQQASVKAIFYAAEALGLAAPTMGIPNPGSMSASSAALMFGGIAVGAGAAGLGISAGIKSAGGYGSSDKEQKPTKTQRKQSFGSKKNVNPVFNINLYMKPSRNSAMGYIGDQRITTRLGLGEMLQAA